MIEKCMILIFFVLFIFHIPVFSQREIDTTKCIYFLDNVKVNNIDIYKGYINKTIEFYYGADSRRNVLLKIGEKYRNFEVYIYVTRNRYKKDEEKN